MKSRAILMIIIGALLVTSCSFMGVRGNGRLKSESRGISEFNGIEASGAFIIKIKSGDNPYLKINAEENLLPLIRTKVSGHTLYIETKKNISPRKEIVIYASTPSLESISCSGANEIYAYGIDCEDFEADLSGAGYISLKGQSDNLHTEVSGAGSIDAKQLIAKNVYISVSGAASAKVYAKEFLEASVSGVGSIDYYGDPKSTNTNVSGVGSISRK